MCKTLKEEKARSLQRLKTSMVEAQGCEASTHSVVLLLLQCGRSTGIGSLACPVGIRNMGLMLAGFTLGEFQDQICIFKKSVWMHVRMD